MKRFTLLLALFPAASLAAEYLELVESKVYETPETAAEITKRGEICIARIVRNDAVRISDNVSNLSGFGQPKRSTDQLSGGPVIISSDPAAGIVVANSRVNWSRMLSAQVTQSTVSVMSKDGRFKIQHTNIETLQLSTGYAENDGFTRQGKWTGSSWEKVEKALQETSDKVAQCVLKPTSPDNW
jgi:hypothetical protein